MRSAGDRRARPVGRKIFSIDGRTGFLVPRDDPIGSWRHFDGSWATASCGPSISAHNRAVAQRFSIAATAAEYERLFSRLTQAVPARVCAAA